MGFEKSKQFPVGNVSGGNQEKAGWSSANEMRVQKVGVFGDDHRIVMVGHGCDVLIRRQIPGFEIKGMASGMTKVVQTDGQKAGELGIHQKLHAAGRGAKLLSLVSRAA